MIMDELKKKLDELGECSTDEFLELLRIHLISFKEHSKQNEHASSCEDKAVQADWTMILDLREDEVLRRKSIHSKKINANNDNDDSDDDDDDYKEDPNKNNQLHSSAPNLPEKIKALTQRDLRKSVSNSEDEEEHGHRSSFARKQRRLVDVAKQREDNLIAHLRDYRVRAEELNRRIALRDNNIMRLEAEIVRLKEVLVEYRGKEKEMQSVISDLQLNLNDLEAQYDEDMTLGQLRDAEHNHVINQLTMENKRLKIENMHLSSDLLKLGIHRTGSANNILKNINDNNNQIDPDKSDWLARNNKASRSYDALSTANDKRSSDNDDENNHCQTSKPADQKIFLNGRIIMSHSTNLQQVLRNHSDFLNATKLRMKMENEKDFNNRNVSENQNTENYEKKIFQQQHQQQQQQQQIKFNDQQQHLQAKNQEQCVEFSTHGMKMLPENIVHQHKQQPDQSCQKQQIIHSSKHENANKNESESQPQPNDKQEATELIKHELQNEKTQQQLQTPLKQQHKIQQQQQQLQSSKQQVISQHQNQSKLQNYQSHHQQQQVHHQQHQQHQHLKDQSPVKHQTNSSKPQHKSMLTDVVPLVASTGTTTTTTKTTSHNHKPLSKNGIDAH